MRVTGGLEAPPQLFRYCYALISYLGIEHSMQFTWNIGTPAASSCACRQACHACNAKQYRCTKAFTSAILLQ